MDVVGIIPARFQSTRFEGKVIADINGKPMIQHVWEKARQAKYL
ncbi:MAG: 3-deoxy-manno-octulosonate cytidylyltransferase, partial [Candidatus Omnitrophica bacterium]|nr:3-deoxy-manno-octulosonate cytidylyltransferase [Candidatus Omnitrophota bacterium]